MGCRSAIKPVKPNDAMMESHLLYWVVNLNEAYRFEVAASARRAIILERVMRHNIVRLSFDRAVFGVCGRAIKEPLKSWLGGVDHVLSYV